MPTKSQSFAASQGQVSFDWRAFLERPDLTDDDWVKAVELATRWVTCSCGQLCAILPRKMDSSSGGPGEPEDDILALLGGSNHFTGAIKSKDINRALHLLDLIDIRVGWLLTQMRESARAELKLAQTKVKQVEAALG